MGMVALPQRIASTYVVFFGVYGDVTRQAQGRRVSRQTIYREAAATQACLDETAWQRRLDDLREQVGQLQERVAQQERELARSVVLTRELQARFAATAEANGVSLPTAHELLKVLQPEHALSVAQLGRLVQQTGKQAGELLAVLDEFGRELVQQASADEIYVPAPVLMVVEPESLCWMTGQISASVNGAAWAEQLGMFPALEQSTQDGGLALNRGVAIVNTQRREQNLAPVAEHLDHFHTLRDGNRARRKVEARLSRAFAQAEEKERDVTRLRRQGQAVTGGMVTHLNDLWKKAEQHMDQAQASERAWQKIQAALRLFTPEGELNTRAKAEAVLVETVPQLPDADFAKTKRTLRDLRTLTYLDEVQRKLQALPVAAEVKQAAIRAEGLRRYPELLSGEDPKAAALRGVMLACSLVLALAGDAGEKTQQAVRKIFRNTWRASSLVEGINSVLRMHQRRHRKMTQGMIDLKRLYWNNHPFRTGRRKGQSPYHRLGLKLPDNLDWWDLLKLTSQQLRDKLSGLNKGK